MIGFSVTIIFETVSVLRRDALCNMFGLAAPGRLNTFPMRDGQRPIFNVPKILLLCTPLCGVSVWRLCVASPCGVSVFKS